MKPVLELHEAIALIVLWFVLGYVFYSVAFAAVGALVSRQEDLNTAILPVSAVLIASFYLAIFVVNTSPNGTVARVAAFLPPFSPMVVPARMVLGDMNAFGLVVAIVLEILGIGAMVLLAVRAYERAILRIARRSNCAACWRCAFPRSPTLRFAHSWSR
jgi:ABC-2 type transport system permease protein